MTSFRSRKRSRAKAGSIYLVAFANLIYSIYHGGPPSINTKGRYQARRTRQHIVVLNTSPHTATGSSAAVMAMLRGLTVLAALTGASGSAIEFTPENWDKEVMQSGKAAFVKFLAPW